MNFEALPWRPIGTTLICILEDNDERIAQFRAAVAAISPDLPVRFWRSAHTMMADLVEGLEHASLISLDHDLNPPSSGAADPGCGYDVIKFLAELVPCCPLIIHTSNAERRTWMIGELSRTRWRYEWVYPDDDDWIAQEWAPVARRMLGKQI